MAWSPHPELAYCAGCGAAVDPRLLALGQAVQPALIPIVQQRSPGWMPAQGICPRCLLAAVAELQRQRSAVSLQGSTTPPTTFPYYHPTEETVLPQMTRLPTHGGFAGRGVTVAFLDSGFYPHPDLTARGAWPDAPAWETLSVAELCAVLRNEPLRIAHYVDLTDHGREEGLDVASLWDGAGDSWHGQMTSVVALGNGLLSGGRLHSYASQAEGLLIKIGRGGGRIPEADILRGLQWLLEHERWQRYGVRVLNISVGGDDDEPWERNAVSRAAEALSQRGVLVTAAAGNSGRDVILPPAQAPSVLTVGGVDDFNRRWSPLALDEVAQLALYHHNWTEITVNQAALDSLDFNVDQFYVGDFVQQKPEVLALGRWLPSPVLPPSSVLTEMVAIDALRTRLMAGERIAQAEMHAFFEQVPSPRKSRRATPARIQRARFWRVVRERMNAHKWIHPYYQHVDGTSVAVAQVSAVAAQMFEANPQLTPLVAKQLIMQCALPLAHLPHARTGAGLIQPTRAVALAMRAAGGALVGLPVSGMVPETWPSAPGVGAGDARCYVGLWWPGARAVSVVGDFNDWQPGAWPLAKVREGWWHGALRLPPGRHLYRFWVEREDGAVAFVPDPENPARAESGYGDGHSVVMVSQ